MEIPPKPERPQPVIDPFRPAPNGFLMIGLVAAMLVYVVGMFVIKMAGG